jgi:hypothetical protein
MYRLAMSILFGALAIYRPQRREWVILWAISSIEWAAWMTFGRNDTPLYVIQSTAALLGGVALSAVGSRLAIYQAFVLLATLFAYLALSLDVAAGRHILIYNHFEAVTYGLVALQLVGVLPTIRTCLLLCVTNCGARLGYFQRGKEA